MNIKDLNNTRNSLNNEMSENDAFFKTFGEMDDSVYSNGAIPKKYKELTGLSISVLTRCEDCILYHLQVCITENANKQEITRELDLAKQKLDEAKQNFLTFTDEHNFTTVKREGYTTR